MELPVKKNNEYILNIVDNGYDGEGIAKIEDFTIFINGAIRGEICRILVTKVNKSYAFGKLLEVIQQSCQRVDVDCTTYKRCGGCSLRHINYDETLKIKRNMVQNLVNKNLSDKVIVHEVIGMDRPYYYRNKLQYPVGINKDGKPIMGIYANRTHEIIPIQECLIQNKEADHVAKDIFNFIKQNNISIYDETTGNGAIRHIIVKIGLRTSEIMCIIVTNEEKIEREKELIKDIVRKHPNVKTVIKNINSENTNVILGKRDIVLYGDGFIFDKLKEYTFKIFAKSFYQTNPIQTEKLYNKALEFANLDKSDVLCDLYCGIGTIGIFASNKVKQVYGIEIVEEAVEAAKENAEINNVTNIEFIMGDVEKAFKKLVDEKKVHPTVIIVDPPRRGLDGTTISKIIELGVKTVVYISCNPATMVRDIKMMEDKYNVSEIQPVDMFPFTSHIEVCALLELKKII